MTTKAEIRWALRRFSGKGVQSARAAIDFATDKADSPPESALRVLLHENGFPSPVVQFEVWQGEHCIYIGDLYLREYNLILEYDGEAKFDEPDGPGGRRTEYTRFDRQRARDNELTARGYRVMHITKADLREPVILVQRIRRRIASAA